MRKFEGISFGFIFYLGIQSSIALGQDARVTGPAANVLGFNTNNVERMRIDETGNVGIGVLAPARLLHVNGPIRIDASVAPGTPVTGDLYIDSSDSYKLKWYNGSGWQTAGGTTPSASAPFACPAGFSKLAKLGQTLGCIKDTTLASATCQNAITNCWSTYGARLPTYPESRIAVAEGLITIAAQQWTGEASWEGSNEACGQILANLRPDSATFSSTAIYRCFIPAGANGSSLSGALVVDDLTNSTSAGTGALVINGGVGIGKDVYTTGTLSTTGMISSGTSDIRANRFLAGYGSSVADFASESNKAVTFTPDATERMRVAVGGNVGIGTTSPTERLEVNGYVKMGYERVASSCSSATTCSLSCTIGKQILGGGCDLGSGVLRGSHPSSASEWTCKTDGTAAYIAIYAICANMK